MLQQVLLAAIVAAGFVLVTGPFFIPELHKLIEKLLAEA